MRQSDETPVLCLWYPGEGFLPGDLIALNVVLGRAPPQIASLNPFAPKKNGCRRDRGKRSDFLAPYPKAGQRKHAGSDTFWPGHSAVGGKFLQVLGRDLPDFFDNLLRRQAVEPLGIVWIEILHDEAA
jgi:hypothetical protein